MPLYNGGDARNQHARRDVLCHNRAGRDTGTVTDPEALDYRRASPNMNSGPYLAVSTYHGTARYMAVIANVAAMIDYCARIDQHILSQGRPNPNDRTGHHLQACARDTIRQLFGSRMHDAREVITFRRQFSEESGSLGCVPRGPNPIHETDGSGIVLAYSHIVAKVSESFEDAIELRSDGIDNPENRQVQQLQCGCQHPSMPSGPNNDYGYTHGSISSSGR